MMRKVIIWSVFAVSCVPGSQDARLSRYLQEQIGLTERQFPKAIVVVSEDGCPHCDRAFADLVRPRTSLRDCLFLIRIDGTTVDLHGFMVETQNVRFDDDRSFKKLAS